MTNSRAVNSKVYLFSCTAHSLSAKINLSGSVDTVSIISIVGLRAVGVGRAQPGFTRAWQKFIFFLSKWYQRQSNKERKPEKIAAMFSRSITIVICCKASPFAQKWLYLTFLELDGTVLGEDVNFETLYRIATVLQICVTRSERTPHALADLKLFISVEFVINISNVAIRYLPLHVECKGSPFFLFKRGTKYINQHFHTTK